MNNRWRTKLKFQYKYQKELPIQMFAIKTMTDKHKKKIKRIRKRPWYPEFYITELEPHPKPKSGVQHCYFNSYLKTIWFIGKENKLIKFGSTPWVD